MGSRKLSSGNEFRAEGENDEMSVPNNRYRDLIDFFSRINEYFLIRDIKNFWEMSILISHLLFDSTILCYYINIFFRFWWITLDL